MVVPLSLFWTSSFRVVAPLQVAHGHRSPGRSSTRSALPVVSWPGGATIWKRPFAGASDSGVFELLVEHEPEP